MSKLLQNKNKDKINEIKICLELFLLEISQQERSLFSYQEIENMLLDIYNLTK